MTVVVVEPVQSPAVPIEDAFAHLRLDDTTDEFTYVESLLLAAQGWLEGPDGWLGRTIGVQVLEARGPIDCERGRLPFGPVIEIIEVAYKGTDGVEHIVDPDGYELDDGHIVIPSGSAWVNSHRTARVRYRAGYGKLMEQGSAGPEWVDLPPRAIQQAILLLVGQWYSFRENVSAEKPGELPFAVEALLSPYRVWR